MEDVGGREKPEEGTPLSGLPPDEAAASLERAIGFRVELVPVEDDELRVDSATAKGLDVRPRYARGVDGTVDDTEDLSQGRLSSSASWTSRRARSASSIARIV